MIGYLIYFNYAKSDDFINSPYNTRQDTFSDRVVRGKIISADGQVLAQTNVYEDGTEERTYPYANMFAHVVGYDTNGKSGLESEANFQLLTSHEFFLNQMKNEFKNQKNTGDSVNTTLNEDLQSTDYNALGDRRGAEADELVLLRNQLDRYNGVKQQTAADHKTRKKSDRNMENYGKIVVADSDEDAPHYKNEYRGRVQDKNVRIAYQPMYALTYYEKPGNVRRTIHYYRYIDELNRDTLFAKPLLITNNEAPLTEQQVNEHFKWIDDHTASTASDNKTDAKLRFLRGLDFYLVQDFENAISDYTAAIVADDSFMPAYFDRALARYKQLEYQKAESQMDKNAGNVLSSGAPVVVKNADYELVKNDLDQVIKLAPDFAYAYYNRANLFAMLGDYHAAIVDYNKVLELDADFADAYYNRGLTYIYLGNNQQGIADLSKAGELGLFSAYNVIKRFTVHE